MNKEEILKVIDMSKRVYNAPTIAVDRMLTKHHEIIYLLWNHKYEKFFIGESDLARDRGLYLDLQGVLSLDKEANIDKWLGLKLNQPDISPRTASMVSGFVANPKAISGLYPLMVVEKRDEDEYIGFELEVTTYTPFHWKNGEVNRGWKQHREYRFQREVNVPSKCNPRITLLEGIVNDHMGY